MKKKLVLVKLDSNYCDYLRNFDDKVPYNYGNKENRPFIGVLFEVGDCKYFAPLSSPKPKHLKLKTKIDFLKIDDGKLGEINFNNMLYKIKIVPKARFVLYSITSFFQTGGSNGN